MQPRRYVPFDVFGMREQVRVSTLVRVGDQGWTCGQCPLDIDATVVAPDDLPAQAVFVCEMIETVLKRGGFEGHHAAQLLLYHAAPDRQALEATLLIFRQAFPHGVVILPIPVPHFYYDGMLLEVDVYADATLAAQMPCPMGVQRLDGEEFSYVAVEAENASELENRLTRCGLPLENLLQDLHLQPLEATSAEATGRTILSESDLSDMRHKATLIFNRDDQVQQHLSESGVLLKETPSTIVFDSPLGRPGDDLVTQTRIAMEALSGALRDRDLTWANVVKISAPYVGSASAADLHENLKIRHSHHSLPGPASTGLPVLRFADPDTRIHVQVIARR